MIELQEVGARALTVNRKGVDVRFGLYLPGISPKGGYEVHVLILHKDDHFEQAILPCEFTLTYKEGSENDLWQAQVHIGKVPKTHFGEPGTYLYRFQLLQNDTASQTQKVITNWFTDPFALATDIGLLSAFVTPGNSPDFVWTDQRWKAPNLDKLVVYELNVEEFNSNFPGVVERLQYLKSLGVTCLELMPITSLKLNFDWGYAPIHYFSPYQRWGGILGLKSLVNACHHEGIAVILDVVYQHVDYSFPYNLLYKNTGIVSPMIGEEGPFGPQIDFTKDFAREYVQTANKYWLHEYHIDGFRYDEVTDLYDGPLGVQYARIAYETYAESLKIPRFTPTGRAGEYSRIIQCTEAQNRPQEVLRNTYTNGTWQDNLRVMAENMAATQTVDENFVHQIILYSDYADYTNTKTVHDIKGQPVDMPVAPFQYLENHDNSQLISFVKTLPGDVPFGDRSQFFKLQPYAIALYTCEGTPMLWQGQEFAENYVLPASGKSRVCYQRNVNWEFFDDDFGAPLVRLYRILGALRQKYSALRSRESFYYARESRFTDQIVAYRRQSQAAKQVAIVVLNFADTHQSINLPFPEAGTYREMIDEDIRKEPWTITVQQANQSIHIDVPSHYGFVFIK